MAGRMSISSLCFRLAILMAIFIVIWIGHSHWSSSIAFLSGSQLRAASQQTADNKVQLEVYYEVLCPDSRHFILTQLIPVFEAIGPSSIDLHLKPYGKATHKAGPRGGVVFECQHGPDECDGNMVHSCAIKHIASPDVLLKYVGCMIEDNSQPMVVGADCAKKLSFNWEAIQRCATSREGQDLLAGYGDQTHRLNPAMTFVPTILINGSQDSQTAILKNLLAQVCTKLNHLPDASRPTSCTAT